MRLTKRIQTLENARAIPTTTLIVFTLEAGSSTYPDTPEARALANGQTVPGVSLGGLVVMSSHETLEGLARL